MDNGSPYPVQQCWGTGNTFPQKISREPWLLKSKEGRNSCPGCGSSVLHCVIWNAPRSAMWSGAGAPLMSCPPHWGRWFPELGDVGCCRKGSCGSCLPTPDPEEEEQAIQIPKESCTSDQEDSCPFRGRIRPCMRQISSHTTGICPLMGESNPCRFGKGYTLRSTTRPPLPGVTSGNYLPWPSSQGGALWVPIHGDNPAFIKTTPVWTLWTIWLPPRIYELWVNTILFLSLMSDSTTPWIQKNDWRCFVDHPEWNRTSSPVTL